VNITESFIDYLYDCETRIDDKHKEKARDCLLDYLGVAYAGAKENGDIGIKAGDGMCSVLGSRQKTDALTAAFVNGYNAHTVELDDGHRFGAIHLGASIVSAILAVAQEQHCTMDEMLLGIVIGYEAAVRCGFSMQPGHKKHGYHTSGTCGTIGAAAGIAFMLHYGREQLKSTISGAATSAAGLLEIQEDSSKMKPYNLAHAAMSAVMAAKLGWTAPTPPDDILGGSRGMLRKLSDTFSEEKLLEETGYLEIERIYVKPYAACRHCHPAMEAVLAIRDEYKVLADVIERIEVYTYDLAVKGHDHTIIQGTQSAKLSMPFSVATAYITQDGGLDAFSDNRLSDTKILDLTKKVSVTANEEFTKLSPGKRVSEVHVLANGEEYVRRVDYAKGDPENPMSRVEIKNKFIRLMKWAGRTETGNKILYVFESNKINAEELFNQI